MITNGTLNGLNSLSVLALNNNKIEFIESDSLSSLYNLKYLNLSFNNLKKITN